MSIFTNRASNSAAEAKEYTAAIIGLVGDRDAMDVLTSTESGLRRAVAGMPAADWARPEAEGKWSVAQVVQHLADSDLVWGWRLRMVLAHDRPTITGYDQDRWADRLRYDLAHVDEAIEQFRVLRGGNLRLLARATPQDLQRIGVHSERGEETVAQMIKMYAGHDLLHLRQIARIRGVLAR
jgi:uncharacterized damage-inducible protein DinB